MNIAEEFHNLRNEMLRAGLKPERLRPLAVTQSEVRDIMRDNGWSPGLGAPTDVGSRFEYFGFHCVTVPDPHPRAGYSGPMGQSL